MLLKIFTFISEYLYKYSISKNNNIMIIKSRSISLKLKSLTRIKVIFTFLLIFSLFSFKSTHDPTVQQQLSNRVEQAHSELWGSFIDKFGVIIDFIGDLPTPEDCILGKPNAIGWWSPIENGPMFTGLCPSAIEKSRRISGGFPHPATLFF